MSTPSTSRRTPAWRRYLRFWGSNAADDVNDELQFHLDMRTREYVALGMTETAARAAAMARIGDTAAAREQCLEIARQEGRRRERASLLVDLTTDVRFAVRSLWRSPGWTAVALLTIALGVGASTAVFSIVDRLLVHPVTYPGASRVFIVRHDVPFGSDAHVYAPLSAGHVDAWRRWSRSVEAVEGYGRSDMHLADHGQQRIAHAVAVDTSFLNFAGGTPLLGRNFSSEERATNGARVVLLGETFWRREFGGARDVVGRPITLDGQSYRVIGVLPASLQIPDFQGDPADVWTPLPTGAEQRLRGVVARVRPGLPLGVVEAELDSIVARTGLGVNDLPGARMRLLSPGDTVQFRSALLMLSGAVALLLLVAAANVAHLLLARSASRERELAVRYAIGAGRWRVVRQLLTESLVLTMAGGVLATQIGFEVIRIAGVARPARLSALSQIPVAGSVLLIALVLTVVTGLAVGLLVGVRGAGRELSGALRVGAGGTGGRHHRRIRSSLVVTEIAVSATLLVGALLLVHGLLGLNGSALGFDPRGLYAETFSTRGAAFGSTAERSAFAQQLLERGTRIAGVRDVTLAASVPPNGGFVMGSLQTEQHSSATNEVSTASINFVAPNYFTVLGIPLIAGRTFNAGSAAQNEVVINESMAKRLWPGESAIGRRYRLGDASDRDATPWNLVVGVTRNAVTHGLLSRNDSLGAAVAEPAIYAPLETGINEGRVTLIVRSARGVDTPARLREVGQAIGRAGSRPTIADVEADLRESVAEPRFSMLVLTGFAVLGVLLAAIGLYGVISYSVAQRTREIGIRMTLGATQRVIARLVVGDGLRLALVGVVLGLAGATAATRLMRGALYGISDGDPWSFAIGAFLLLVVSALACVVPAWRATSLDPVVAVRNE